MKDRYSITIFATALSIIFAVAIQFTQNYAALIMNIEIITLPVVYILGYEIMMDKQKFIYEQHLSVLTHRINLLKNRVKKQITK